VKIAELPFHERPVLELLNLDVHRDAPDRDYAGYGWARVDRIWLDKTPISNALVLALHSADDGEVFADDVELELELDPGGRSVLVLLSRFLEVWLPKLPQDAAIVLAMCNPARATLRGPVGMHYGLGDVESWLDDGARIRLAAETWCMVST
jgi:hypothetical protein